MSNVVELNTLDRRLDKAMRKAALSLGLTTNHIHLMKSTGQALETLARDMGYEGFRDLPANEQEWLLRFLCGPQTVEET